MHFDPNLHNQAVLDALLRTNLSTFIHKSFQEVSRGDTYFDNWHIHAIARKLQLIKEGKINRLIINIPPRHLKSICVSVAFPAWLLGHDPTRKIICASYSQDLAKKHALDCRTIVAAPWFRRIFPKCHLHPSRNTDQEFMTTQMGMRLATSVEGSLTGRGGDLLIIDDPIKPGEIESPVARNRVIEWFNSTAYTRLNNKKDDAIIIIMQRLHIDDLVGYVVDQSPHGWDILSIPAIAEQDTAYELELGKQAYRAKGRLIDDSREDLATLEEARRTLGSQAYSAQYQQRPVPAGGNMIKIEWFSRYDQPPARSELDYVIQSWDTANKATELNDYSVCTTWGIKQERIFLLDVMRAKLEFPDLKRRVLQEAKRYLAHAVFIEEAGSGTQLIQCLRSEESLYPVFATPKNDKVTRTSGQTALIEAGHIYLPNSAPWLNEFLNEVSAFPAARHDDQVDSMINFLMWRKEIIHKILYDSKVTQHLH